MLLLAAAYWWYVSCKPSSCNVLRGGLLAVGGARGVLGVAALLGYQTAALLVTLAVLGGSFAVLTIANLLARCCAVLCFEGGSSPSDQHSQESGYDPENSTNNPQYKRYCAQRYPFLSAFC